jgi:hypothetical protein
MNQESQDREELARPEEGQGEQAGGEEAKKSIVDRKNGTGYYYWVNNDKDFFKGASKPDVKPQKVQDPSLVEGLNKGTANAGSVWNSSGTWEEKQICTKELQEALNGKSLVVDCWKVSKVEISGGYISHVMVRGKKKLGYNFKLGFKIKNGLQKHKVTCEEFSEYEDPEVRTP